MVSASGANTQSAACWVVTTPNGRYAHVTNTGSGTISRYSIRKSGQLTLAQGIAATSGAGPIDAAIAANRHSLFVLNAGGNSITSFAIDRDGSLAAAGSVTDLPAGSNGLAAKGPEHEAAPGGASALQHGRAGACKPRSPEDLWTPGSRSQGAWGNRNSKRVPRRSSECTRTALPCRSRMRFTMARPSPELVVPPDSAASVARQ